MSEYTHFLPGICEFYFKKDAIKPIGVVPIEYLALWRMFGEENKIEKPKADLTSVIVLPFSFK